MFIQHHNAKHVAASRRGALAVLVMFFVAIGVVGGGLTLNWAYGVLVQRDMHHKTDALALAGARALLHPDMLTTSGAAAADVVLAVENAVGDTLAASNSASPLRLQLADNNLTVTLGRVADVTQLVDDTTFVQMAPYNTVRVIAKREQADGNPVTHLISQFGAHTFAACEVGAQSYATLDNFVVGVRPTSDAAAPVMPLAIEAGAWMDDQLIDNTGGTPGVEKFTIRLFCGGATPPAPNAAVVAFNGNVVIGTNANLPGSAPYQITHGIVPDDLPAPDHVFGPIASAAPAVVLDGRQTLTADESNTLAAELNAMIGGVETCRIFSLYELSGSDFRITAIVGARVLSTAIVNDHLEITVEKCFVVHPTVLTSTLADGPNALVHKLRISR